MNNLEYEACKRNGDSFYRIEIDQYCDMNQGKIITDVIDRSDILISWINSEEVIFSGEGIVTYCTKDNIVNCKRKLSQCLIDEEECKIKESNSKIEKLQKIYNNTLLNEYYFTFGSASHFPYQYGWVEVFAESRSEACNKFYNTYPYGGSCNCSSVYDEASFMETCMVDGNGGKKCHEVIF